MEKVFTSFIINDLFSHSVVSDSFWPQGLQHARHPCHSPFLEFAQTHVHWVSDAIQPSCPLLSLSPPTFVQSFLPSGSFLMSQFFASGSQSTRASASTSVLPMNIQDWFPSGVTDWIFLLSNGLSCLLQHHIQKHASFGDQPSLWSNSHIHSWLREKP